MNWGKGLGLFIAFFILAMLGMVYVSFRQTNEMLEDHYYDREIRYQEVIDGKKNLQPYIRKFAVVDSPLFVIVQLPEEISQEIKNGEIRWIKMDKASADKTWNISSTISRFDKHELVKGQYHLKLRWTSLDKSYFYEGDINVN